MSEKINKSFLTEEAKSDINEMLDNNSGGGGSSFTTQIETSEGLTLGKGTENEGSLSAQELATLNFGKLVAMVLNGATASSIASNNWYSLEITFFKNITGLKPNTKYSYITHAYLAQQGIVGNNSVRCEYFETDSNGNVPAYMLSRTIIVMLNNLTDTTKTNVSVQTVTLVFEGDLIK